jgi:predicted XRE-type DNA-binding protein
VATRVRRASTNVSRDLGFSAVEAENLRIRAGLMTKLVELIRRRGLTQAAAARLLRVSQPRVSDLVRGRIERFSIDMLVTMLARAGLRVKIVLSPRSKVA